jgi:CubicO group peptidase (beta-lactamase class C family)
VIETLVTGQARPLVDAGVLPGCVVGVWRDGQARFFGFGGIQADGSGPTPDERTLYEIGEVTLDTPIADLFPDGRRVPQRGDDPIRLWHLATHCSGLPGMPTNLPPTDSGDPYSSYSLDLLYDFLAGVRPARAPEAGYEYSNLASGLLGQLLAARAGVPWHELVRTRLFEPLGMHDSVVLVDEQTEARVARPSAEGLTASRWGGMDALAPCGAVVSSAADLLRFAAENIEPSADSTALARAITLSHTPRFTDPASGQVVALGWHLAGDGETLWHNGMTGGYSSMLLVHRPARTAVVVLTNSAAPETTGLGDRIMRALLTGTTPEPPPVRPAQDVDEAHLDRLVGDYASPLGFTIHVTREGGRLGARLTGQTRFRVYAEGDGEHPARFVYRIVPAALAFDLPADGGVASAVTLEQNGMRMRAERSGPGAGAP